jgi:transcriptional regulator with XRE-family HTH domain
MASHRVDVSALYEALDTQRASANLSWRQVAQRLEISHSALTRMSQGHRPDVDSFVSILAWLGEQASRFVVTSRPQIAATSELIAQLTAQLRLHPEVHNDDVEAINKLLLTALEGLQRAREAEPPWRQAGQ